MEAVATVARAARRRGRRKEVFVFIVVPFKF